MYERRQRERETINASLLASKEGVSLYISWGRFHLNAARQSRQSTIEKKQTKVGTEFQNKLSFLSSMSASGSGGAASHGAGAPLPGAGHRRCGLLRRQPWEGPSRSRKEELLIMIKVRMDNLHAMFI